MLVAVLMNAILQLRSRDARDVIDAESWVRGDETTDWPFSFNNICKALGIESSYFASGLLTWREWPTDAVRRAPLHQVRAARDHVVPLREKASTADRQPGACDQEGAARDDVKTLSLRSRTFARRSHTATVTGRNTTSSRCKEGMYA